MLDILSALQKATHLILILILWDRGPFHAQENWDLGRLYNKGKLIEPAGTESYTGTQAG